MLEIDDMTPRKPLVAAIIAAGGLFLVGLVFFVDPQINKFYPPCMFHELTGFLCPGCGCGQAVSQLMHGHLLYALGYNPFVIILLPFILYRLAGILLYHMTGKKLPMPLLGPKVIVGLLIVIVAFWVLRNIPVYPLTLLRPHRPEFWQHSGIIPFLTRIN
ncbi:MAG: DUF2752 domain-containing protein [Acidobacteriota bacterium]